MKVDREREREAERYTHKQKEKETRDVIHSRQLKRQVNCKGLKCFKNKI
jgi:hypothetical protein